MMDYDYLAYLEASARLHAARLIATYRGGVWRVVMDGHHIHGYTEGTTLHAAMERWERVAEDSGFFDCESCKKADLIAREQERS